MSHKEDRERAEKGQLFRGGMLVSGRKLKKEAREATEKAFAEAEKAKGDLAVVGRWLAKASEEQALRVHLEK